MIFNNRYLHLLSLILFSLICSTQLHARKKHKPAELLSYSATYEGVTISVSTLSKEECKQVFGFEDKARGYQPLKITIKNGSHKDFLITDSDISWRILNTHQVINLIVGKRPLSPVLLGLCTIIIGGPIAFFGSLLIGLTIGFSTSLLSLEVLAGCLVGCVFFIPVVAGGVSTFSSYQNAPWIERKQYEAQKLFFHQLLTKELPFKVRALKTASRYIFVSNSLLNKKFTITTWEKNGVDGIEFPIELSPIVA